MNRKTALAALAILAALPAAAGAATPVRLILPWQQQAQFAGYYAALERGLYARSDLDVTILRGGPDRDPVEWLRTGRAEFGVFLLGTALTARGEGVAVVNCAQVVNRSNLVIIAWRDRGVRRVGDLEGRRLGMWEGGQAAPFLDFLRERGVRAVLVPQFASVELFLRGGLDACVAMEYNEYNRILQAGTDPSRLTVIRLRDASEGMPEDGIYALEAFVRANPGVAERFATASLAGWRWAAKNRGQALDLTMVYLRRDHVAGNLGHMRWMLETLLPSIFPGPGARWTFGRLERAEYERATARLTARGLIRTPAPYDAFTAGGGPLAP